MRAARGNGGEHIEILATGLPPDASTAVLAAPAQAADKIPPLLDSVEGPRSPKAAAGIREEGPLVVSPNRPGGPQRISRWEEDASATACSPQPTVRARRFARLADAPEEYRRIAEARANILSDWQQRARALGIKLSEAVDPAWAVSASTLWGWKRRFEAHGLV